MSFVSAIWHFFTAGAHWRGSQGIPQLFAQQAELSAAVVAAALVLGGGVGAVLGHSGRGALIGVNAANAARAVPTLALLTLFAVWPAVSLRWNGFLASSLALLILAIPPILTNTYVGMREVDPEVREAARAMGLTGRQVLTRIEAPLAVPFVMAGVRTAAVEVVATSTLAAYVSYSDLGTYVLSGLNTNDTVEAFCGAVLVAVLAGAVALGLGALQRVLTPVPLRRSTRGLLVGSRPGGRRPAV